MICRLAAAGPGCLVVNCAAPPPLPAACFGFGANRFLVQKWLVAADIPAPQRVCCVAVFLSVIIA